jgi:hypothetical protein
MQILIRTTRRTNDDTMKSEIRYDLFCWGATVCTVLVLLWQEGGLDDLHKDTQKLFEMLAIEASAGLSFWACAS